MILTNAAITPTTRSAVAAVPNGGVVGRIGGGGSGSRSGGGNGGSIVRDGRGERWLSERQELKPV